MPKTKSEILFLIGDSRCIVIDRKTQEFWFALKELERYYSDRGYELVEYISDREFLIEEVDG